MSDEELWEFYSRPENQVPTGPPVRPRTPTRRPTGSMGNPAAWTYTNAPIVSETSNEARIVWKSR